MILQRLICRCFTIIRPNGNVERTSSQGACGNGVPEESGLKRVLLPVNDGRAPCTGCVPNDSPTLNYEQTRESMLDAGYLYGMRTERSFFVNPLAMGSHDGGIPIVYAGAALAATSIGALGKGFNNPLAIEYSDCSFPELDSSPGIETCTLLPCVGVDCSHAKDYDNNSSCLVPPAAPLHSIKIMGGLGSAGCEPSGRQQLPADAASCSAPSCEHTLGLSPSARSGSGSGAAVANELTAGPVQAAGRPVQQQSTDGCSIPNGLNSSGSLPGAPLSSQDGAAGNSCEHGLMPPCSADVICGYDCARASSDSASAVAGVRPSSACVGIAEEPCSCPRVMRVQLISSQEPLVLSPETPIENETNRMNVGVDLLSEQQELDIEEEGALSDGSDVAATSVNGAAPSDGFAPCTPPLGARDGGLATAAAGIMPSCCTETRPHGELADRQGWSDSGEGDGKPMVIRELPIRASLPPRLQVAAQPLLDLALEPHQREASKPCALPRPLYSLPVCLASKDSDRHQPVPSSILPSTTVTVEDGGQVPELETAVSLSRAPPITKSTLPGQGSSASVSTSVRNGSIVAAVNASASLGSLPSLLLPNVPFAFMRPHLFPLLGKGNSNDGDGGKTGSGSSGVDSNKVGLRATPPMGPITPEVAQVPLPDPGCSISGLGMTRLLIRQLGLLPEAPLAHNDLLAPQLASAGGKIVPSPFANAMDAAASALDNAFPTLPEKSLSDFSSIEEEKDGFEDDHEAAFITCTLQLHCSGAAAGTDAVSSRAVPAKCQGTADAMEEVEQWDPEIAAASAGGGATDAASILSSSESSSIFDGRGSSVLHGALSISSMQGWLEPQGWKPLRAKYCCAQVCVPQTVSA
ncbi:hypothetical protein Vretimale_2856 [Volvox reticuliferus]|uniref:Uncharacterized protein n=1 Tax=Volvox reticuliferus TaxID=1737510 RepID=A0A8J4DC53_9CHLO|nr:hypothetical protein Vretimale_2856 [Volvox reticuliferus]